METIYITEGSHIFYDCGSYLHHGIYCGDITYNNRNYKNVVINFEGKFKSGKIKGISFDKFAKNRDIYVMKYKTGTCYSDQRVVQNAISRLGEPDYNLFGNNCEHFAHWCKTGKKVSSQVNDAIGGVGNLLGGLVGGLAIGALLPLAIPEIVGIGIGIVAGVGVGKAGEALAKNFVDREEYSY